MEIKNNYFMKISFNVLYRHIHDLNEPIILSADSSNYGLGAVLYQKTDRDVGLKSSFTYFDTFSIGAIGWNLFIMIFYTLYR